MRKYVSLIVLVSIVVLGIFLRFYKLDTAPPGLLVDEPNYGYNAYSILKTGRDEFGQKFPLSFRSYGDQKLPAYIYAAVIPVKIFGLTPLAVRFPSLISGILVIVLAYIFLRLLKFSESISLLGALVTAVSPWTIILSRFAWESSVAFALFFIGVILAVRIYRHPSIMSAGLTGLFLGASWYGYLPFRPVSFVMLAIGTFWVLRYARMNIKYIGAAWLVFILTVVPLVPIIFSREGNLHAASTSIFTNFITPIIVNENRTFCMQSYPKLLCYLNSNKAVEYFLTAIHNFDRIFSLDFLFFRGEPARYLSVENYGLLPFLLIPFYLMGLVYLVKEMWKKNSKAILLLIAIIVSVIPAVLSDPQRVRLAAAYPFFLIILSLGLEQTVRFFKKRIYVWTVGGLFVLFGLVYLFNYTATHVPKYFDNWEYIGKLSKFLGQYDSSTPIYIKPIYAHPISYFVFYNRTDPRLYQKTVQTSSPEANGYFMVTHMGNVTVESIPLAQASCRLPKDSIYVTDEKSSAVQPIYTAKSTSGIHDLAYVYEVKNLPPTACR